MPIVKYYIKCYQSCTKSSSVQAGFEGSHQVTLVRVRDIRGPSCEAATAQQVREPRRGLPVSSNDLHHLSTAGIPCSAFTSLFSNQAPPTMSFSLMTSLHHMAQGQLGSKSQNLRAGMCLRGHKPSPAKPCPNNHSAPKPPPQPLLAGLCLTAALHSPCGDPTRSRGEHDSGELGDNRSCPLSCSTAGRRPGDSKFTSRNPKC